MTLVLVILELILLIFIYVMLNKRIKTLEEYHDIEHQSLKDLWEKIKDETFY